MSSLSRRSLLGYSGTTAAGAVLGSAASAQPAQAAEAGAEATATEFEPGTFFKGSSSMEINDNPAEVRIEFRVSTSEAPESYSIAPLEIAQFLNELAVSRGWPPVTFYGTPLPAPLN
ncbi:twin-arginine translocation signal domain-containing protein [Streptomyces sp. NBC_00287]|uniref:twin-arginine translocation signal domain-containing protein n=1 Tax=Streptomyces sp. NBC_00287 TaxID=2975702 RepID=UPI002E2C72DA|nr:twin-arginine translocation signal domain-containing protein [Streptomyces sp. NBC_00287]